MTRVTTTKYKIISYQEAGSICRRLREDGKTSIVKTGCFDFLHIGHIRMFERCKEIADYLIVFVGSDEVLKTLYRNTDKANPYFDEDNRIQSVAAIACVDFVVMLNEPAHNYALSIIKPDYYHIPTDDKWPQEKQKMCDDIGIKLIIEPNTTVINHGLFFEPHSTAIKNEHRTTVQ